MHQKLFVAALAAIALSPLAHAVDWQCGYYRSIADTRPEPEFRDIRYSMFEKQVTLNNGEVVTVSAPLLAVTEDTTDFVAALKGDEKICIKTNQTYINGGLKFLTFGIKGNQQ